MKQKVTTYSYERISTEKEVDLPEKIIYFWHNSIRRAYSVKPVWTTWNKEQGKEEEIYKYDVVEVDPSFNQIRYYDLAVYTFGDVLKSSNHDRKRLIESLLLTPDKETRTQEQFMADYNRILEKLQESL